MSTLYLALNTGKGSKGGAPAAEVSLNLHVTINQTENSDYPENSGIQSSNMKSDLNSSTRNEETRNEFVMSIMIIFYFI